MSVAEYRIVEAEARHMDAMLALMPRLADYDIPPSRDPRDLWRHDVATLKEWLSGDPDCIVHVAVDSEGEVLGLALVRMRPELLSEKPSAHLEALALDRRAEGRGIARALLDRAEHAAREKGALTMTLHVFTVNERARRLYERAGYDGELMRYIKHLAAGDRA
jgi:ribosomal protein S18 acetylase RimI-like enzyme